MGKAFNRIKDKCRVCSSERRCLVIYAMITGIIAALFAIFLVNKKMSPAEGWYSYYAYLINEDGAVPYVDFELLFPPLYTYLIAFITKIFGYNIMALRIFGVLVFSATAVFAFLIFEKLTHKKWLGLLGGFVAVAVLQSEIVQIFYDYIRIMDLCVFASVYFFLRYVDKTPLAQSKDVGLLKPKFNVNILFGAIFAVLASMCKQSSGLIFLLFCIAFFVFILILLPHKKELALQIGTIVAVAAIMYGIMFVFLISKGAFEEYIRYNFVSSVDSKGGGSILSILFGWIPRAKMNLLKALALLIIPAGALVASIILSIKFPHKKDMLAPRYVRGLKIALPIVLVLSVVLPFLIAKYASIMRALMNSLNMYVAFLFGTLFFALAAFALIFKKRIGKIDWQRHLKYVFLSGVVFVLAYSVCTSGGLAESQTALGVSFMLVTIISAASFAKREIMVGIIALSMVFQGAVCFARKVDVTYAWWGLDTGSYSEQTTKCNIPIFKGIKMTPAYAQMYNHVYNNVIENTEPGDEIFVFPHMPVLYVATDRPRATETAIQWFDVATDEAIISDIDVIRQKKPTVIVLCEISEYPMKAHENNFREGNESGLRIMQDFLKTFVEEEGYVKYSHDRLLPNNPIDDPGYEVSVWVLKD